VSDASVTHTVMTRLGRQRVREVFTGRRVASLSPGERDHAHRAGYELAGDWLIGRDPREMLQDELRAIGHEQMSPMEAIRAKCLDCCAGSAHEVRCCTAMACPSWPFRTTKNPWRAPISEERREALRKRSPFSSRPHKTEGGNDEEPPAALPPHPEHPR
jgi:hypothetical protein